jgi:putative MATE family efflux protein
LKQETDLGTADIKNLLFRLALPAVTAQIVNVLYNMVDRIYVGHIPEVGTLALTGLGVCMPLILIIAGFSALIGNGGSPRASILMGKGQREEAEKILGNCATALLIISVTLTPLLLIFADRLLLMFGASENTIPYASGYMGIYVCGTIFVQLSMGLNAFITAQGFAKISMISILIGAVCNIILDPLFIFGLDMGVEGAALATILSQGASAVWVLRFLTGKKTLLRIRKKNLRLSAKIILPCLALGLAPFIMQSTESLVSICFNSSLLKHGGDLAVGAMTILATVMQLSMLPLAGLAMGGQPIIGYNFGAGKAERVKAAFKLELRVALVYTAVLWLLVMLFPQLFARIFTGNTGLIAYAAWALRIYMASSLLFGIQLVCQMAFIAIGNAKASLFLAVLRKFFLLIPLMYLLPNLLSNQVMGVFLAEPIADFITVATTSILFWLQFRKALRTMEMKGIANTLP